MKLTTKESSTYSRSSDAHEDAKTETNEQKKMMVTARAQATFNSKSLTEIILGSKEAVAIQDDAFARLEKILGTSDTSRLPRCYSNMNHEEAFLEGLRAGKVTMEDSFKYRHDVFLYSTHLWALGNASPFGIHTFLFMPSLKQQSSPEQYKFWVPLAESGKILGAYCQTELGHGTHVGGIETTATFEMQTDEFIINTPTLSSTKFWPGALGFTCSHAIVMARLIVRGKDLGIHAFMVQVRSLVDYKPMKGIELGDIGMKMAYNGTDNGFAVFHKVRIPRTNMLSRYANLDQDGNYARVPLREKMLYGGMLNGRFIMIRHAAFQLAQALTIATRYSVVREQGHSPFTGEKTEMPIIQFKTQHYRLLVLISKAYANLFTWKALETSYKDMVERQAKGDHSTLPHNHILMCGLKAWSTETASNGAEDARKMCGGHGYLFISGLPEIVSSVTAMATFEGENWVMWQQVSLYLMKGLAAKDLPTAMSYMVDHRLCSNPLPCAARGSEFLSFNVLQSLFEHRAAQLTFEASELLTSSRTTLSKSAAWNKNMMTLIAAARAHVEKHVLCTFIDQVSSLPTSPIRDVLSKLVSLYGLTTLTSPTSADSISFFVHNHISPIQLSEIREQVDHLLEELLPDAIALTDAWNFTDASLCSAIGMRDGNAYERVMEWVRQLDINVNAEKAGGVFREGFENYIEPVLRAKL
ncbi:Peroxisomal acyl-coenzyme A oxidase 1 [Hyphodiscus hymeniophilus]|uniref:Acyl-coenzyme A oxidase n=1 Tax=Hyphodiscus hymeniophilus TaxID=353542 RepID=A0A9P6VM57_9HELO|nr:Peroxisomal acyl-coenzyme A oxidase 1 [Hyphodiscus hymeniophilus]